MLEIEDLTPLTDTEVSEEQWFKDQARREYLYIWWIKQLNPDEGRRASCVNYPDTCHRKRDHKGPCMKMRSSFEVVRREDDRPVFKLDVLRVY